MLMGSSLGRNASCEQTMTIPNKTDLVITAGQPVRATELRALHDNTLHRMAIHSGVRNDFYGWKQLFVGTNLSGTFSNAIIQPVTNTDVIYMITLCANGGSGGRYNGGNGSGHMTFVVEFFKTDISYVKAELAFSANTATITFQMNERLGDIRFPRIRVANDAANSVDYEFGHHRSMRYYELENVPFTAGGVGFINGGSGQGVNAEKCGNGGDSLGSGGLGACNGGDGLALRNSTSGKAPGGGGGAGLFPSPGGGNQVIILSNQSPT